MVTVRHAFGLLIWALIVTGCAGSTLTPSPTETPLPTVTAAMTILPASSASPLYQRPEETDDGWQTASPADVGMDPEKIRELLLTIRSENFSKVDTVLLVKDGYLIVEEYANGYDRDRTHYVASVTKSITSIVLGIAMDQGLIDGIGEGGLDKTVLELFPGYEELIQADPRKEELQLRHILSMSAGLAWDEQTFPYGNPRNDCEQTEMSHDVVGFVLEKPVVVDPGSEFLYSCGLSNLLSALIQDSTGRSAGEFADETLFGPLGIEAYRWERLPSGLSDAGGGLHMRPRDMAKIGQLFLNGGEWDEQQIVSQEWVEASIELDMVTGVGPEYGFQWWGGSKVVRGQAVETFFASGFGGQLIFVFPDLDLVVVITQEVSDDPAAVPRSNAMLIRHILPSVLPAAVAVEPESEYMDRLVGTYLSDADGETVTIYREGDSLFLSSEQFEGVVLMPESPNRFIGTAMDILDFTIIFADDAAGINHLDLYIDFRQVRFDRVE